MADQKVSRFAEKVGKMRGPRPDGKRKRDDAGEPKKTKDLPPRPEKKKPDPPAVPRGVLTIDPTPSRPVIRSGPRAAITARFEGNLPDDDDITSTTTDKSFVDNLESAGRTFARGYAELMTALSQGKSYSNRQIEKKELLQKRVEEAEKKAAEAIRRADDSVRKLRVAEETEKKLKVAEESERKLKDELARQTEEHAKYIAEVVPVLNAQAVEDFKSSEEFLQEYKNGMDDLRAVLHQNFPDAYGAVDWVSLLGEEMAALPAAPTARSAAPSPAVPEEAPSTDIPSVAEIPEEGGEK